MKEMLACTCNAWTSAGLFSYLHMYFNFKFHIMHIHAGHTIMYTKFYTRIYSWNHVSTANLSTQNDHVYRPPSSRSNHPIRNAHHATFISTLKA